ncbi:MAG: tetratricopeptide repeat protein [Fuerstiella sp.]
MNFIRGTEVRVKNNERQQIRFFRTRFQRLCLLAGGTVGVILFWLWPPSVADLYRQSEQIMATDPDQAERLLREALQRSPEFADAGILLGRLLGQQDRWDEVQKLLSETPLQDGSAALMMQLADDAESASESELARTLWVEVSGMSCPEQPAALQSLFRASQIDGRDADSLKWARRLTQVTSDSAVAWWQFVGILESQKRITDAVEAYRQALACELPQQDRLEMRLRLLDHLIFLGDVSAARQEVSYLRMLNLRSLRLDVAEARLHRMDGNPEQALAILNRIRDSVDNSPRVIWLRGRVHLDLGSLRAAASDFERALQSLPEDEVLHFNLAEVYRRLGEDEKSAHHQKIYQQLHRSARTP